MINVCLRIVSNWIGVGNLVGKSKKVKDGNQLIVINIYLKVEILLCSDFREILYLLWWIVCFQF